MSNKNIFGIVSHRASGGCLLGSIVVETMYLPSPWLGKRGQLRERPPRLHPWEHPRYIELLLPEHCKGANRQTSLVAGAVSGFTDMAPEARLHDYKKYV